MPIQLVRILVHFAHDYGGTGSVRVRALAAKGAEVFISSVTFCIRFTDFGTEPEGKSDEEIMVR